jgi:hypothetical protein
MGARACNDVRGLQVVEACPQIDLSVFREDRRLDSWGTR